MSTWVTSTKAAALAVMLVTQGGCVERLIFDFDTAGADAGSVDTDSDGIGETEREPGDDTDDAGEPCTTPDDCGAGQTCFEGVCVGEGTVRVSLSWDTTTDLDLHVLLPDDTWINFENTVTNHGELDVDDCVGGLCVDPNARHVENIFLYATAPRGTYRIFVVNFDGRRSANYAIEVAGEVSAAFSGTVPAVEFAQSDVHAVNW